VSNGITSSELPLRKLVHQRDLEQGSVCFATQASPRLYPRRR
jgi:hypothetical protein